MDLNLIKNARGPRADITEADYKEIERLGAKLGIPVPLVHISLSVSKDGKPGPTICLRSHTWNRNFWNHMMMIFTGAAGVATNFGAGYISLKNTAAAVAAVNADIIQLRIAGHANNSTFGIVAGRGAGAEDFEGAALTTIITHGTGANQMSYAAHSANVQAYVAGTKTWTHTIKRILSNISGAQIDVTECALYYYNTGSSSYFMLNRDLLGAAVPVPNNQTLTIAYDITLTLPA